MNIQKYGRKEGENMKQSVEERNNRRTFRQREHSVGAVFGDDNRIQADSTVAPYNAIVRLEIELDGDVYQGTGFMTEPEIMLTAAHNLYDYDSGKNYTVSVCGTDGNTYQVYKQIVSPEYKRCDRAEFDWAVAAVTVNPETAAPCLNLLKVDDAACPVLKGMEAEAAGYPGEVRGKDTEELYTEMGNIVGYDAAVKEIHYNIDTSPGQSGSPVIIYKEGIPYAVGIHNEGSKVYNIARAIDKTIADAIAQIRQS